MEQSKKTSITLPNSTQHDLVNPQNNRAYRIQISWPLKWAKAKELRQSIMPVMYILDGNALFLTATEILWRREISDHFRGGGIVVAIGYPSDPAATDALFDTRRNFDLTTPMQDGAREDLGGAHTFLEFIEEQVKPLVRSEFPGVVIGAEAIFGYSLGGLVVLYALFTRTGMFGRHIAASPSIWWDDCSILRAEGRFISEGNGSGCSLDISFGSLEQKPRRAIGEPEEVFADRVRVDAEHAMADNAVAMHRRLLESGALQSVSIEEFQGEDHGTAVTRALLQGLVDFFDQDKFD